MKHLPKKPHLLITTDTISGVWNYSLDLIWELGDEYNILLASQGPNPTRQQARQLESLPHVHWTHRQYALEWMDEPWAELEKAGEWLMQCQDEFAPDLVHLNSYCQASLPWQAPIILVAHSCVLTRWRALNGEAAPEPFEEYRKRVQAGLDAANIVVFPTSAYRDAMSKEYLLPPASEVIWNGRNPSYYRSREKVPQVFSAGRLWDESKNMALLNRIAPSLHWPVIVCGPSKAPNQSQPLYSHLISLGNISEIEVAERLEASPIYAAPATYEPFGLAILEAAMSGCALVLADIPTLRELWDDAAIFLPPHDDEKWIEAINMLSDCPVLRKELGKQALQRSKYYTTQQFASKYRALYSVLATGSQSYALLKVAI